MLNIGKVTNSTGTSLRRESSHGNNYILETAIAFLLQDKNQPALRANRGSTDFFGWENL